MIHEFCSVYVHIGALLTDRPATYTPGIQLANHVISGNDLLEQ